MKCPHINSCYANFVREVFLYSRALQVGHYLHPLGRILERGYCCERTLLKEHVGSYGLCFLLREDIVVFLEDEVGFSLRIREEFSCICFCEGAGSFSVLIGGAAS